LQWGLNNTGQSVLNQVGQADMDINMPEAWDLLKGRSLNETVVAVLDTGVDIYHTDLAGKIWVNEKEKNGLPGVDDDNNGYVDDINGWDFYHHDNTVFDSMEEDYHGTHVAGIIAAGMNNNQGIAGIAPNAKIMPLKFISGDNGGTTIEAIEAIRYAQKMGVKIANNSWGGAGGFAGDALEQAIKDSRMLFVVAAGNEGTNNDVTPSYPSSYASSNILSVAAADNQGRLAGFSNYGRVSVDVAAPGVGVVSTIPRRFSSYYADYGYSDGTSMAAPHVTGLAALMMGYSANATNAEIMDAIKATGKPLLAGGWKIGSGKLVDAQAAIAVLTPVELTSVQEIYDSSDYIEGKAAEPAKVTATVSPSNETFTGFTDAAGTFKIKTGHLPAGASVMVTAYVGVRKSAEKKLVVQKSIIPEPAAPSVAKEIAVPAPEKKPAFKDVGPDFWAFADIEWAVSKGLVKGYDDKTFKPYNRLTEAQLAVILSRYFNPDIEKAAGVESWYSKYYDYLRLNGILLPGHANRKVIEKPVNRITMARSLAASQGISGSDNQIIDWMYDKGLTTGSGRSANKYVDFASQDSLSRTQISAFFQRMNDKGMVKIASK